MNHEKVHHGFAQIVEAEREARARFFKAQGELAAAIVEFEATTELADHARKVVLEAAKVEFSGAVSSPVVSITVAGEREAARFEARAVERAAQRAEARAAAEAARAAEAEAKAEFAVGRARKARHAADRSSLSSVIAKMRGRS